MVKESGGAMDVDFWPFKKTKPQKTSKQVVRQISICLKHGLLLFEGRIMSVWQIAQGLWLCIG